MKSYLLKLSVACVLFAMLFIISAASANAQLVETATNVGSAIAGAVGDVIGGVSISAVTFPVRVLMYMLTYVEGIFIMLAGYLVHAALTFNVTLLNFKPPFVTIGWGIFRDIANLGFVLGIVLIAVMTILRIKGYQAQQILWKLIVAALVVNFSLLIGSTIIRPANSVSCFLLNYITASADGCGSSLQVSAKLGDAFRFNDIVNSMSVWSVALGSTSVDGALSIVGSLAVISIFGLIMFLTLLSFAGMLFLRYFYLAFLLVISPIAWLMWIFPGTKKYAQEWWSKFIHWVIFAPLILLFLYIALLVLDQYPADIQSLSQTSGIGEVDIDFGLLMTSLFAAAILIGGLKMASKMGHGGTQLALGAVDSGQKWAKGKLSSYKKSAIDVADRGQARIRKAGLDSKWGQKLQGGLKSVAGSDNAILKYTGLRKAAESSFIRREERKVKLGDTIQGYNKAQQEHLKALSPDQLYGVLAATKDPEKRAAVLEQILQKDKKVDTQKIQDAGLDFVAQERIFRQMYKTGRIKEANKLMKNLGTSLDSYEFSRKERDQNEGKALPKSGGIYEDATGKYIFSEYEKDENGQFKKKYLKEILDGSLSKYSEQDVKDFVASNGKDMFSSVPPKKLNSLSESAAAEFSKKFMDLTLDPFTKFYQATASRLEKKELKNHYTHVVNSIIERVNEENTEADLVMNATAEHKRGNYEGALEILEKSKQNPDIARMAKKIGKTMGSQLSHVSREEGGGGGTSQTGGAPKT